MIRNGKKQRRHHIEGLEFLFKKKVQADRHNYCVAYHTYLLKQFALKNAAERACQQGNAALINKNGDKGENNAVAQSCAENNGVYKVKRTFDEQHGAVTRKTVID